MLQTMDTWEEVRSSEVIAALFNEPGVKRHRCVEVALNLPLFHVDLAQAGDHSRKWSRYVLYNFADVTEFLALEKKFTVLVSLQTRLGEDRNYEIFSIKEILAVKTEDGRIGHFFVGVDGRRHSDAFWDQTLTRSITTTESIWIDRSA